MTFQQRLLVALSHEDATIERLNRSGWTAYPFGQSQLPDECRDRLKRFENSSRQPSLIRWMPDIITFRDITPERSYVALIDAKVCGDRPNYAIEMSAVETLEIYADRLYTPAFFVFDDWRVLTPREARQRGRMGPDPTPGNGSGTPYYLIAKHFGHPFDEVFHPTRIASTLFPIPPED